MFLKNVPLGCLIKKLKLLVEKPTAQSNIEQKLPGIEIDWSKTYSYARQITLDSHSRIFFYKLINNILHKCKFNPYWPLQKPPMFLL